MDGQTERPTDQLNIKIISNLLEDDLVQPQIWPMHHMPAMYILVIREVTFYYFVNYTEQEVKKERNRTCLQSKAHYDVY